MWALQRLTRATEGHLTADSCDIDAATRVARAPLWHFKLRSCPRTLPESKPGKVSAAFSALACTASRTECVAWVSYPVIDYPENGS